MILGKLSALCTLAVVLLSHSDVGEGIVFREEFASAVVDQILYVHGGTLIDFGTQTPINEFYALNLSTSFNVSTAPWTSLNETLGPIRIPALRSHVGGFGGPNNNLFFIYGGINATNASSSSVYYYDPSASTWNQPAVSNSPDNGPVGALAVSHPNSHIIYIYDGQNSSQQAVLALDTHDLTNLNFKVIQPQVTGPPGPRAYATWSLLSTGVAVLIGGSQGPTGTWFNLTTIYTFDTTSLAWSSYNTTGIIPSPRIQHSAVVTYADEIVVYGGTFKSTLPPDPLVILSTANAAYTWRALNLTNSPYSKYEFTLTGVYFAGNALIFFDDPDGSIHDLDTNAWQWTNSYVPHELLFNTTSTLTGTAAIPTGTGNPTFSPFVAKPSSAAVRVSVTGWVVMTVMGALTTAMIL